MSLNANDGSGLLFQFLYLSFDNDRHFPRCWNEESVHIKHSDFVPVTRSELQTIKLVLNIGEGVNSVTLNVMISGCRFLLVILTMLERWWEEEGMTVPGRGPGRRRVR